MIGIAEVLLFRRERSVYTDYVFLYKLDGEWRIVSKLFHARGLPADTLDPDGMVG
jgi:hypothetical protein